MQSTLLSALKARTQMPSHKFNELSQQLSKERHNISRQGQGSVQDWNSIILTAMPHLQVAATVPISQKADAFRTQPEAPAHRLGATDLHAAAPKCPCCRVT